MATDSEPAKLLLPYLQRADELQKHDPLVAYYCRLYAMERGLKIPQSDRTKTTNSILVSLMKQLEKDKKSLNLGPDDHLHLEGFALNVFAKADKQDRAGRADLNVAKTFYAASIFFEILNQFGQLPPDLEQKQKYAAWKAADIRKALKEGRTPCPGPPGSPSGDDDLQIPSMPSSGDIDPETSRGDYGVRPGLSGLDAAAKVASDPDLSSQFYDQDSIQHLPSIPPQSSSVEPTRSPSSDISPSPHYPTDNYPSNSLHQPPPPLNSQHSIYQEPYSQQTFYQEPHQHLLPQHLPQHYPSQDKPPLSYPNFQSYPSFTDSSLPTTPSHYPSYYHGPQASYINSSSFNTAIPPSPPAQHNSISKDGSIPKVSPQITQQYEYDSNYQPPPEKITEAHKAARFAVGALAFDDVSVAVDYLKKSLELLTNPSSH